MAVRSAWENHFVLPLVEFVHSRVAFTTLIKHIVPKNILCADTNVWISSLGKIYGVTSQKLWDQIGPSDPNFLLVSCVQKDLKNIAIRSGNLNLSSLWYEFILIWRKSCVGLCKLRYRNSKSFYGTLLSWTFAKYQPALYYSCCA